MQPNALPTTPAAPPATPTALTGVQKVQQGVAALAPEATTFTSQTNLGSLNAQRLPTSSAPQGILENLASFVGTVAGQTGGILADLGKNIVSTVVAGFTDVGKFVQGTGDSIASAIFNQTDNTQSQSLNNQRQQLVKDYQAGRINLTQYQLGLKYNLNQYKALNTSMHEDITRNAQDVQNAQAAAPTVVEDIVAIATAGISEGLTALAVDGVKTLADGSATKMISFFGQHEVSDQLYTHAQQIDSIVQKAISGVNKVSTINGKFSSATIATITHDTIGEAGATLTSKQIAKNVAVNLLLKRPLIYQTNVGLASSIYTDMQKGNLTGAALTTALTASMALAGGPIGWAMEVAGRGLSTLRAAMFSGGNVADLLKTENEENIRNGSAALVTQKIIDDNAKTSVSSQSFIDALSTKIGGAQANQMYNELIKRAGEGDTASYEAVKVLEQTNMKMAGGNSVQAAELVAAHYNGLDGGAWLRSANAGQVIDDMINWASARQTVVEDAIKNGMNAAEAKRIVIGRANQEDLGNIANMISETDKKMNWTGDLAPGQVQDHEMAQKVIDARLATLNAMVEKFGRTAAWANSDTFMTQLNSIIKNNTKTVDMVNAIMKLRTQAGKEFTGSISQEVRDRIQKQGYFAILPETTHTPYVTYGETTGGLKTQFANGKEAANFERSGNQGIAGANLFEHAVTPMPVLSSIGAFLTKIGLSPEAAQTQVQKSFQANFNEVITKSLPEGSDLKYAGGQDVLAKLYSHVRDMNATQKYYPPVTDLRQMTTKEIVAALGSSEKEAKIIMSSLNSAMLQIPLAVRGLGDKLIDINAALNPIQRYGKFSRIQGAAHFVWNPFFRWQQSTQTEGLAQAEAGGKLIQLPGFNLLNKVLFPKQAAETKATITMLEDRNIFGQGFSGVGSTGDIQGQIGTRIIPSEKMSLAGLVNAQAKKQGFASAQDYIDSNQSQVVDMLRMITTNNHTSGFLDSPLARTINTAFFPFRYNMKVANLMAGYIGKLSAPTQVALVAGLINGNEWLQSNQGVAWQSTHSEAIGLFNWLSPTYPLSYIVQLSKDALGQSAQPSVGDLGQLGGLPFGMISQLLESSGVIQTQAPYMDMSTGEVYPKYVPKSAIAGVSVAIQDLLGSLFSYPGALVGLPGKTSLLRNFANGIVGATDTKDYTSTPQTNLTPEQLREQAIIQKANPTPTTAQPANTQTQPASPDVTTIQNPGVTAAPRVSTKAAPRAKKASFRPTPL